MTQPHPTASTAVGDTMPILGGTDTARVERLREIMAGYHQEHEDIPRKHWRVSDDLRLELVHDLRRRFVNRVGAVLAEEWEPSIIVTKETP